MLRLTQLLLVLLLAFHTPLISAGAASDGMQKLCSELAKLGTCKTSLRVPSAKVRMGKITWFKVNKCKTKLRFPFGRWTCLPGTDKVVIEGPVGIEIGSAPLSTCELMKKTIPGLPGLIQKTGAICKCMPDMVAMLDVAGARELVSSRSVGGASAKLLSRFSDLSQCAIDAGLNMQDNKAGLAQGTGSLVTSDHVRVFQAAEMDLSRYLAFAGALAPCFTPASCQPEAIKGFFEKYLADSERLMSDQVKGLIKPWSDGLGTVESSFGGLSSSTKAIADQINRMQSQAASIINDICPNAEACANHTLADFKKQVETTLDLSKQVAQVQSTIGGAVNDAKAINALIKATEKAFDTVGDLSVDAIVAKVVSGQFRSMEELGGAMKAAQRIPSVLDDLQSKIPNLQKVVGSVGDRGPAFVNSLSTLMQKNWLSDYRGDQATAARLNRGVGQLQQMFADWIPHATELHSSLTYLTDSIGSVVSTGKIGTVDVQVASYQRWTKGNFDTSCLTTGNILFNLAGFKSKVPYPKFYRCKQNYNVPFPNHHIPFVRITLPQDSSLAKFAQGLKRTTTTITWARPTATYPGEAQSSVSAPASISSSASTVPMSSVQATPSSAPSSAAESQASVAPSVTSVQPAIPRSASATSAPTPSAAPIKRAVPFGKRQDDQPDVIPPDLEVSSDIPALSGYNTDSAVVAAQATVSPIPTGQVFSETVISGVTSTIEVNGQPTGTPTTEVVPDPADATITAVPAELRPYNDLKEETLETVISTWEDYGTVSFNMADPTLDGQSATSAAPSATASMRSAADRSSPQYWIAAVVGVGIGVTLFA